MERNTRKVLIGTVVSDKRDKTITIVVDSYKKHRLYGKRVKFSKKFSVHDEEGLAKVGDTVKVMETRPLSKTKKFRLLEILEKKEII